MLKKIILIFTIITVAILLKACCDDIPRYFRYSGMNVKHVSTLQQPAPGHIVVDTSEQYTIIVNFDVEYLAAVGGINPSAFFINSAYATQPCDEPGFEGTKDKIASITITSDAEFDTIHRAGKSLNKFFTVYNGYGQGRDSLQPKQIRETWYHNLQIRLMQKPVSDTVHTFKVHTELYSGKSFTAFTPAVTFRKK